MAVNLHATHFRFGNDDGTEVTHTFMANLDTNVSLLEGATFLLRFTVQETGGSIAANTDNQFQCSLNGGAFQNITTSSTIVKAVAVNAFVDAANCTKRLTGTGTFETSGAGCTEDGLSGGNNNDIAASGNSETECGLQVVAASVAPGDTITFRLTSPDFTITNDVVPTVTVSSGNISVTPGVASLTLTPFTPTVSATDNKLVTPGLATLTLTPFAPTVTVEAGGVTVTPGTASLTLTPFAPAVTVGVRVIPGVAALILTPFAPQVTATENVSVTPGTASLTLTPFTPSVTVGARVTPGVAALALEAFAPTVTTTANVVVTPGTANMVLTPYAPTVTVESIPSASGIGSGYIGGPPSIHLGD